MELFKKRYLNTFKERKPEKSYNVSDRYKWVKYFNYHLPCGTKEYYPGLPIVNGTDAPENFWPWQVLIHYPDEFCGGVMIDALWVLTAAHCVQFKDKFYTVYFGCKYSDFSDFILFRTPILIVLHDEFNSQSNSNDIALLKLDFPVAFTSKIRPACLPIDGQEFSMNDRCYITGYGERYKPGPSVLQQLKVYFVPDREYTYLWKLTSGNINWRYIGVGDFFFSCH
ncbi:Chymotrypsin-like elastase member 2A [Bulinus truncatus]|nr:Chymotrypsin-like elastase member 2A [Bulinus truncatus]